MRLWLFLIAFMIGCSSQPHSQNATEVKKAIQVSRAINSPDPPRLKDSFKVAESKCLDQGGKLYYTDFPNGECQVEGKTIFAYFTTINENMQGIITGVQVFFRNDNGGIMHMAVYKYGPPKWEDGVAVWYNPNNNVTMTIDVRKTETILSLFYLEHGIEE